jgi:GTPase SAR1 family protein
MTSLPEYATLCWEDKKTNRARASIDCFHEIVNNRELEKVPFILVLNKVDMLPHVLQRCKFSSEFAEFEGSDDSCTDVIAFMKDMYMKQYTGREQSKILPIVLNTMDTTMMKQTLNIMVDVATSSTTSGHSFKTYDTK